LFRAYSVGVARTSAPPVVLRNGVVIEDPLSVVLGLLKTHTSLDFSDPSRVTASFGEPDLRYANRGGARISATEINAILERRATIERALGLIAPRGSLAGAPRSVPWPLMGELFEAFADIRGVGFAKMTKALHPKRPALVPILDSIVQRYLDGDDVGPQATFGERALGLVRGYKRDLDANRVAVRDVHQGLAKHSYEVSEVRVLDLLILSVEAPGDRARRDVEVPESKGAGVSSVFPPRPPFRPLRGSGRRAMRT
jgi:Family of unknown function (DUF6308)